MTKLQRWEKATGGVLTASAVIFLAAWSWPLIDPDMAVWLRDLCDAFAWITWAMVAVDYVVRISLASDRKRYFIRNLFSLVVVLLPMLRPLRVLRLVTLLSAMNRRASTRLRGKVTTYAIGGSLLLIYCGGVAVLEAERGSPGASIATIGDALWWAITTMTTVGYGDYYPVTAEGKVIAAGLMVSGIALLGAVTATLASWLVDAVQTSEQDQTAVLLRELADMRADMAALRAELAEYRESSRLAR